MYDKIDMSHAYTIGFWTGAVFGGCSVFGICLLLGLYL